MSPRTLARSQARRLAQAERREAIRRRRLGAAAIGAGALLASGALAVPAAHAATFTVTTLADGGAGSLRDALTQANAGPDADTVVFADGLTGQISLGSELDITNPVIVQGPATPGAIVLDGADATRLIDIAGPSSVAVTLSGLRLQNGNAGSGLGGAVRVDGPALTLTRSIVTGNAANSGGGVFVEGEQLTVTHSTFDGNQAADEGGAIGTDGYDGGPGGIVLADSVITGNTAGRNGGGASFYDNYNDVLVERTTVSGNTVGGAGGAYEDGGGIWFEDTYDGSSTTVRDSTVTGNTAADAGGGLSFGENFYGPVEVINTTVSDNRAAGGAGIQFNDIQGAGSFTLRSSTVSGNTATARGGGVLRGYLDDTEDSESPLTVVSSVISGNAAGTGNPEIGTNANVTDAITIGNSLVQDVTGLTFTESPAGTVLTGVDPQLGPLGAFGGPVQTRRPSATSPLLDAGVSGGLTGDARGLPRTAAFPGLAARLGSDGTDIGAVELQPNSPPVWTVPASIPVTEDTVTPISGVRLADADDDGSAGTATFTVTPAGAGTLTLADAPAGTTGDGTASLTVTAPRAEIDAALAAGRLTFTPARDRDTDAALVLRFVDGRGTAEGGTATGEADVPLDLIAVDDAASTTPPLCDGVAITLQPTLDGRRVRFAGVTLQRLAGQRVAIRTPDRREVASATVRPDGSFAASAPAPAASRRATIRYQAVAGDVWSTAFRLERRALVLKVDGREISGEVRTSAALRRGATARLYRDVSCSRRSLVGTVRLARDGAFRATTTKPPAGFAVYRLRVALRGQVTWTQPVLVLP